MVNKREIQTTSKSYELVSLTCDICGKEYSYNSGNVINIQEFHHIYFTGGYGSKFGDGTNVRIDICDSCLYEKFKDKWNETNEEGDVIRR